MRRGCFLSMSMLVVLLHATPAWATAFTFESLFDPTTNRLDVNIDVVDVADLLPGSFGILGFEFDIAVNPAILTGDPLLSVDLLPGDFLTSISLPFIAGIGDPFGGTLTVLSAILGPVPTGATADGRLATVSFFNVNPGVDPNILVTNVHVTRLIDASLEFPEVDRVQILPPPTASVPEPSSLALVALGVLAMRRRRRAGSR
ncbi:MAG TPA: PEP-CTERM sorting domain-containing protein [Vicinamibacterales bacterium]